MLLSQPDLLVHILSQITRQDAIRLSVTSAAVHQTFVQLQTGPTPVCTPAPRVVICASDSQQLLLMPLTHEGQPYICLKTQHKYRTRRQTATKWHLQVINGRRGGCVIAVHNGTAVDTSNLARANLLCASPVSCLRRLQWLTGVAFSPYDLALYVAAYGAGSAPASILRFSAGSLRYVETAKSFHALSCNVLAAAGENWRHATSCASFSSLLSGKTYRVHVLFCPRGLHHV